MALADRDYMKDPPPPAPRLRRPAGAAPSLWQRLRFWFWRLLRRGT